MSVKESDKNDMPDGCCAHGVRRGSSQCSTQKKSTSANAEMGDCCLCDEDLSCPHHPLFG